MPKISKETKDSALSMLLRGHSTREVEAELPLSFKSAARLRPLLEDDAPPIKAGRPKKWSPYDARYFGCLITSGKATTATQIAEMYKDEKGRTISCVTVARALNSIGMSSAEKVAKPALSETNKAKRLKFALEH